MKEIWNGYLGGDGVGLIKIKFYRLYIERLHRCGNQYLAKLTYHVDNLIPRDEYLHRICKR